MPGTLSLPDLDALDHAALKTLVLAQPASYARALGSRAEEIERFRLLEEKQSDLRSSSQTLLPNYGNTGLRHSHPPQCTLKLEPKTRTDGPSKTLCSEHMDVFCNGGARQTELRGVNTTD